jgi:hypothetical protein
MPNLPLPEAQPSPLLSLRVQRRHRCRVRPQKPLLLRIERWFFRGLVTAYAEGRTGGGVARMVAALVMAAVVSKWLSPTMPQTMLCTAVLVA